MKPYYQEKGIQIFHGDCREVLPALPKGWCATCGVELADEMILAIHLTGGHEVGPLFDLVVTDPPYGISDSPITQQDSKGRRPTGRPGYVNTWHPPSLWDKKLDPRWGELCAMAASTVVWFGHWRKREEVASFIPLALRAEIVWCKDMHTGPPCPVAPIDERIWVFSQSAVKTLRFETSVWREPVIPTWEMKFHKNEKPIALMTRVLSWLDGDRVLDPFIGSGTTLAAAKKCGKAAVGIEIEERYCEIAAKRLSQEVLQFA